MALAPDRRAALPAAGGPPRSMPRIFASLKVAITVALVGSIIRQAVAAHEGFS